MGFLQPGCRPAPPPLFAKAFRLRPHSLALPMAALLAAALLPALALPAWAGSAPPPQPVGDGNKTPKLELRTWGSPQVVRNPVALWVTDQGVVYTAENERPTGEGIMDTRQTAKMPDGLLADLSSLTVADRVATLKRWEREKYIAKGSFTKYADVVRVLRDTTGGGAADTSQVIARFGDWADGINAGVMELDGAVYATCIPNLWKITENPAGGGAPTQEALSTGWGVRWAFHGHDMHGLVQGPDGRIYFSIADRGFNVTTQEGVHYDLIGWNKPWDKVPDPKHVQGHCRGGVFRCWPDGSGLEMVFEGLRNPQGLAFDDAGNLFTGDNNCDAGDPARFCYLPEHGDAGWRQDVQTFDKFAPKDGTASARGPWLRERMAWPRPADPHDATQPAWMIPPVMTLGNGPAGMAHFPGTGHAKKYADQLMMVNFTGGSGSIFAVKAAPQGAFFSAAATTYLAGRMPVDLHWGPDGRLYCTEYPGWKPNDKGNVFTLTDPAVFADKAEKAAIDEVQKLLKDGMQARKTEDLLALLGHRNQRVRQRAQSELARRDAAPAVLAAALDAGNPALARTHAIWSLWQKAGLAAAAGKPAPLDLRALEPLLADKDAFVRTQAARVLGDLRHPAGAAYAGLLKDADAKARFYACLALGNTREASAIPALFDLLKDNAGRDPVLRHGAARALAQIASGTDGAALPAAAAGRGPDERVGLVLALRQLRSPLLAKHLHDNDTQVAAEAARAIYDMQVLQALPALAGALDGSLKPSQKNEPFLRRAIEAAAQLGRPADARALVSVVTDESIASPYKLFALECLTDWDKEIVRERVWGHLVRRKGHPAEAVQNEVLAGVGGILKAVEKHRELADGAGRLMGRQLPRMTPDEMVAKAANPALDAALRGAMLARLAREAKDRVPDAVKQVLAAAKEPALRIEARELLAQAAPPAAQAEWFKVLESGSLEERQAAVRGLAALPLPGAQSEIAWQWHKFESGSADPALGLDILEAAAASRTPKLAAAAEAYRDRNLLTTGMENIDRLRPHAVLISGGNAARGEQHFRNTPAGTVCIQCHNAGPKGAWDIFDPTHEPPAFPNLGNVAALHPDPMYLVRAILSPNADIAPGFASPSAMPDEFAEKLTAVQVRDLVAFLQTRTGSGGGAAAHGHEGPPAGAPPAGHPTLRVFAFMFGAVGALLLVTVLLTLVLERGKAKLS